MKLAKNFVLQEFVPRAIYKKYGKKSIWWVNPKCVDVAQFYKEFWYGYYKAKYGSKIINVYIVINNWHSGGRRLWSGYRPINCKVGSDNSQHRAYNAFDCKIILKLRGRNRNVNADYKEVHRVIQKNEKLFLSKGITTIEHVYYAKSWLHTDFRQIPNQKRLFIVKP